MSQYLITKSKNHYNFVLLFKFKTTGTVETYAVFLITVLSMTLHSSCRIFFIPDWHLLNYDFKVFFFLIFSRIVYFYYRYILEYIRRCLLRDIPPEYNDLFYTIFWFFFYNVNFYFVRHFMLLSNFYSILNNFKWSNNSDN